MKSQKLHRLARLISFGLAAVTLMGFGSCSNSVQDICMRRLPEFDNQVSGALARLAPSSAAATRGPASTPEFGSAERDLWLEWTERRLSEAQHYMDAVDGRQGQKAVQRELSDIATALVQFHGYARQGRGDRMEQTLERIQARSARARGLACTPDTVANR